MGSWLTQKRLPETALADRAICSQSALHHASSIAETAFADVTTGINKTDLDISCVHKEVSGNDISVYIVQHSNGMRHLGEVDR